VRVIYFGTYERRYPRNAQVISCLRRAGVGVVEHHAPVWDRYEQKWNVGVGAVARLALAQSRLLRRPKVDFDALIVGYPGHLDLTAARRAAAGRPVVFNPLVSLVDTFVADRGRFRPGSVGARVLAVLDRRAFRSGDLVIADTAAHAEFLSRSAGLPRDRIERCFVGAEERLFQPRWRSSAQSTFVFVGKLIPLHGVATILAAARLAPELQFRIVGSGQLQGLLDLRPPNVEWLPWVEYGRLPSEYHGARAALGIFGTSAKAHRVIPNKVFQALASGAPVVTADTPAARELLDDETAVLIPPGDPGALAAALQRLAGDNALAAQIAAAGHDRYRERASEEVLGRRWRTLLERLLR
jgi:glycosyltransferase involved in cell wall biosynthesis